MNLYEVWGHCSSTLCPCPDGSWAEATCTAFPTSRADCDPQTAFSDVSLVLHAFLKQSFCKKDWRSRNAGFLPPRAEPQSQTEPRCTHPVVRIEPLRAQALWVWVSGNFLEWVFLPLLYALVCFQRRRSSICYSSHPVKLLFYWKRLRCCFLSVGPEGPTSRKFLTWYFR